MRIDCDIHPGLEGTRTTLLPYLDDHWKEQVTSRGIDGLDLMSYPPTMPLSCRPDWRPKKGKPGSDFEMRADLVLLAMGFVGPEKGRLLDELGVRMSDRGTVARGAL